MAPYKTGSTDHTDGRAVVKLLLIVNPSASSVTPRSQVLIQRALSQSHDVELGETARRGHATRLAEDAASRGFDGVVVLGGDGTLNEVANGLAHTDTALIPLPGGSTNVFARTLGLPDDPLEATATVLRCLDSGLIRRVGLGRANDRLFLFHVGVGFDAAVVEQVERNGDLKRYLSHALFVYAAIRTWFTHFDRSRPHFSVTSADGTRLDDGYLTICLNTDPYTYLGSAPLNLAPNATLDTGITTVTLRTLRSDRLLRTIAESFRGGLRSSRRVAIDESPTIVVRAEEPFPHQLDGDFLGRVTELHLSHEPDSLLLVRPDLEES